MRSVVTRAFARIKGYPDVNLPVRKTMESAGYDIEAAKDMMIEPGQMVLVPTGVKAYMLFGEYLQLALRSSLSVKRGLMLMNGIGVVDADYADNEDNEGHIMLAIYNTTKEPRFIDKGERIAQGIFQRYLTVLDDRVKEVRTGGFGSTNADRVVTTV